ncbi:MAG TPA: hypothetical protein VK447_12375 [Myxococcaceae bacterium]|nr:hypothetical protein [Myxococcaceae bacterium]
MHELARWWSEGGFWMYPIAMLLLVSLPATLVMGIFALVGRSGSRVTVILSTVLCALGLLILIVGFVGWQAALRSMEEAVAMVNPADKATILATGTSEARTILIFAGFACVPSLIGGVALLGLGLARLPRFTPPEQGGAAGRR